MPENEIVQTLEPGLTPMSNPEFVLIAAKRVGDAVNRLVKQRPDLVKVIGGRRHPRIELLQIVGAAYHLTARARATSEIQYGDSQGWECEAEAYHIPTGHVVATAQSMCTSEEPNWATRTKYVDGKPSGIEPVPSFQRRSMAQTRACSKALRLAIGWVLGMAGYETTPAEEMSGSQPGEEQPARNGKAAITDPISQAQLNRLFAIAKSAGKERRDIDLVLIQFRYASPEVIQRKDYEAICTAVASPRAE